MTRDSERKTALKPTTRTSSTVPSFQDLLRYYHTFIGLGQAAHQLREHALGMDIIALNAGITASNSTENRQALLVLGREAGTIAKRVGIFADRVLVSTQELIQVSLTGIMRAQIHGHLRAHWMDEEPENEFVRTNIALISAAYAASGARVAETLARVAAVLDGMNDELADFEKQNRRIRMIAVYFRTEASRDHANESFFNAIAEQLGQLGSDLGTRLLEMQEQIRVSAQRQGALA